MKLNFKIILVLACSTFIGTNFVQAGVKAVAFDCHGVLVERRPWTVQLGIARFLYHHYDAIPLAFTIGPQLLYSWFKGTKLNVAQILYDFPDLKQYKDDIYEFIRLRNIIQETIALIKRLKEQGVVIILASNMAQDTFDYNRKIRPKFFDLFDIFYISVEEHGTKKDPYFYQCLKETVQDFTGSTDVDIVFVDDDQRNIDKALEAETGIDTILFTNPEELEEELIELGYLLLN